ncbi:major facilitator transporter [Streptomonospora alba]|uniref:Major facilitator transporter n=1 Tax=Streptomonospora alba TaxID=183763 RepID=A0A0C2JKU2_9ACTN|nr:MFS transporter [Streptomonospora alba]KIH99565.1 major facilitator transporter [Streptomonospora alba]
MPLVALAYYASHLLSLLGNGIASVALPLIVLQTTGSPLGMSALATAAAVPSVVAGLLSGVIIDRINRLTASVVSDVISAAAIAALPLVDMLWGLDLVWFILLGILGAFGDVPGMTAREVLAPMVARHAGLDLRRVVGVRQTLTSVALVVGPAAAGVLLAAVDSMAVLWITAATSALAAVLTRMLPRRLGEVDASRAARQALMRELVDGLLVVGRSRFLMGTTFLVLGLAVALGGLQGLVMPVYFDLISRPELLGLVLTVLAAGMLVGATIYSAIGARLSSRTWLSAGFIVTSVGFALMASLLSPAVVFAGAAALGLGNSVVGAVTGVLQVQHVPGALLGRVLSVKTALLTVAAPAGIGLAGVLAELGSPLLAAVSVTGVWILVLLAVIGSRALRDLAPKEMPDAQQ